MSRSVRDLPHRLEVPQVTLDVLGDSWRHPCMLKAFSYQVPITQLPGEHGYSREGLLRWIDQHGAEVKQILDVHATHPTEPEIPWRDKESVELWLELMGLLTQE